MKVRALQSFASDAICPAAGQVFEVSDEQGKDWIKAGLVVPAETQTERAVKPPAEKREKK